MELKDSHGGFAGKSIIEKIQDKVDEALDKWIMMDDDAENKIPLNGRIQGMCYCLGLMKNTDRQTEFGEAMGRWADNH
jgi:hypothetical protein